MLIYVVTVGVMKMPIMQVVYVVTVLDGSMTAIWAMYVVMIRVFVAIRAHKSLLYYG